MCRSSRSTIFFLALAILPTAAQAQFYGFPSEVGVIDDGFGVLPPLPSAPPLPQAGFADASAPPFFPGRPARRPCPVIIKGGPGLRHLAGTRIVYGQPGCS